jgi:hypothetical protein
MFDNQFNYVKGGYIHYFQVYENEEQKFIG